MDAVTFDRTTVPFEPHPAEAVPMDERLLCACVHGNAPELAALLAAGADPMARSEYGATALHVAAQFRHADIIEMLLARPDVVVDARDAHQQTPLLLAVLRTRDDPTDARLLLAAGADPDAESLAGMSPRSVAVGRHKPTRARPALAELFL